MSKPEKLSNGEEFVPFPGLGWRPKSTVRHVPDGVTPVAGGDGEVTHGLHADGKRHDFPPISKEAKAWLKEHGAHGRASTKK